MDIPAFPNGFDSWHKTHFEVVEALCYLRDLEETRQTKNFAEMLNRSATEDLYQLAKTLTDRFEEQARELPRTRTLFEEIEDFVAGEIKQKAQ
ncbi:hypothetical protein A8C56_01910 [Niabella ginsenosidivorans]|uniref:Uncharacterized protein n=1 Tax=Niabella ginsenosidivorans TaxID=1176587 RepID=A0A1A9HWY8_9BACT|nr:hypothetical protein [Niabella ginsenosidivorans]ANH79896.1 hypothetical protein A8C56_01910 [Niabella ginsenosidivorans]